MIAPAALRLAGPGARLVARPRSAVVHVYDGPMAPSGRCVPRGGRAVCNSHTRRLHSVTDLDPLAPGARRVCDKCAARLRCPRPAEPVSRTDWINAYGHLTAFDLAVDAFMATTVEEVDRVEFLALLVVGFAACHRDLVVSPTGKATAPLQSHLRRARTRVDGTRPEELRRAELFEETAKSAAELRRAASRRGYEEREERIKQLGFVRATA